MNNALMAISSKPEIAKGEVTRKSVFDVCSRAANDGVVLDGKEAAMVLGSVKRDGKWVKEAQYRLMAGGAMKIIQRSPNIERVVCQLIYENDEFVVDFVTTAEPVVHKITPEALKKGRGEIVGVYFTAKLKNGEWTSPEIMSVAEVNAVRDGFSQKNSEGKFSAMWEKSWGEAAKKTVLHRARKRLPLEGKIDSSLDNDDLENNDFIDHNTGEVLETAPAEAPKKSKIADKVKAAAETKVAKPKPEPKPEPEPEVPAEEPADFVDAEYTEESFDEEPPV
jgi:recombination protein RecT